MRKLGQGSFCLSATSTCSRLDEIRVDKGDSAVLEDATQVATIRRNDPDHAAQPPEEFDLPGQGIGEERGENENPCLVGADPAGGNIRIRH
ncbi:hypothetical protein MOQ72_32240 [Saccharopolyspora sp. K220]|uniref:hypothetical protein n=1 Tax=Saccharopolyspora soli TaxID=2926618 RepID=UPI001F5813FE|nr:hypothetical protein [Saccharopolyspora soli]MCI2422111.1 hypothetical protein [Saccharopolyspora soli]